MYSIQPIPGQFESDVKFHTAPGATMPKRGTLGSAGYDLYAIGSGEVPAWGKTIIHTGITMEMAAGIFGRIASRSGLSVKNDIEVGAGIIDSDYRGELLVVLRNFSDTPYRYDNAKAIAQIIIQKYVVIKSDRVGYGIRGTGGFGSTDCDGSTDTMRSTDRDASNNNVLSADIDTMCLSDIRCPRKYAV